MNVNYEFLCDSPSPTRAFRKKIGQRKLLQRYLKSRDISDVLKFSARLGLCGVGVCLERLRGLCLQAAQLIL